ncbi:MAG: LptF/LptG family permease, partial [Sedimentisphaerales bacterium]|nr:LptF/LptG family permease [Sedimentisphaerales bacterium]
MNTTDKNRTSLNFGIIDRYVSREYLISYLIAIGVLLGLRIMVDVFIELDEFVETSNGQNPSAFEVIGYIFNYYGPKTFEYFRDLSGTIVLIAAAFSLARMTRQNELVAILASGISLKRVIAPIVLLGLLLNCLMIIDQEFILPRLAHKLVLEHDEMAGEKAFPIRLIADQQGNALLYSISFDPQTKKLQKPMIIFRQQAKMSSVIKADSATWDDSQKLWILENGIRFTDSNDPQQTQAPVDTYSSELTPEYLALQRNSAYKSLMSSKELAQLISKGGIKSADKAEALSERHSRFTDPIINMIMLLIGLPMLVTREKKNNKIALAYMIAGAGGCFIVTFVCKLLASGNIYVTSDTQRALITF